MDGALWSSALAIGGAGLGYGLRHAFESDHIAAVTTIVVSGSGARRAALVGAAWGLGHALAVVTAGAILIAAGVEVPKHVAVALELGVVALLCALGLRSIRHRDDDAHAPDPRPARTPLQALAVGLAHGASGTAALVLLTLAAAPSRLHGVFFLLAFALGATLSMTLLSAALALPLGAAVARFRHLLPRVRVAAGLLSFVAAVLLVVGLAASS